MKGFVYLTWFMIGSSLFFFACSSPSTQVAENLSSETELVTKRNWSMNPKCCELKAEFLGVVVLDQICITDSETKLKLHTKDWKRVCVLKEGMVFRDDLGTHYSFLKSEGVDLCPKRTKMKDTSFYLSFESMSNLATSFDLIEDKNAKHAHKPWVFEKVDLMNCQWK
ncbi:hypothetical protein [Leptospira biflexa]|uniref:hypothetical protein n=1 Tax=Leptospira biflexa TaxID=172 RepID=UPI00108434F9|nr:hypothetical protein [Leptospira biflexa]TGM33643.1 hypothetical protein EHQ89_14785 [Leptospira biflexa]TGM34469.1 hypothetical protein EHQ80_14215 [Leptospira biflexa]TGM57481.1 hypothetical protein EHQ91_01105 [Leptospira biflexa]